MTLTDQALPFNEAEVRTRSQKTFIFTRQGHISSLISSPAVALTPLVEAKQSFLLSFHANSAATIA